MKVFLKPTRSLTASYPVALVIACSQKYFFDGELIKRCVIEMAKAFANENSIECFKNISSSNTMSLCVCSGAALRGRKLIQCAAILSFGGLTPSERC